MNISPAYKKFKLRFGQANHFLITTLVGLDAVQSGTITKKPDSFSTIWNPKDSVRSAERSRIFVLKSFLGWAVESLEMYLTEINRDPKLLKSEIFTKIFLKAKKSIYKKTIYVGEEIGIDPILIALMEVMITWRNHTFHYDIDNTIRKESLNFLRNESESVKQRFSGLDIDQLYSKWELGKDFSFKETASLIKATQDFVKGIDEYIIANLKIEEFISETIKTKLWDIDKSKNKYLSFNKEKRIKYIRQFIQNTIGELKISDEELIKIMNTIINSK